MSCVISALKEHACRTPLQIALQDQGGALTYGELPGLVDGLADQMLETAPQAVGILADNGVAWALADLAALQAGIPVIPLPLFFSPAQLLHVLKAAGIEEVLTDQPERLQNALQLSEVSVSPFYRELKRIRLPATVTTHSTLPVGTRKVTFTSGTTGEPKGVCLGLAALESVAASLQMASGAKPDDRHLCLLPLSTLLENIAGIYTPLLAGATVCVPRLADVGLSGSSGLDIRRMLAALGNWQACTAIMVPQMLQAMVVMGQNGAQMPTRLRYLAVGGAPVSASLRENAEALGLPIFEGYGLSECASVVAVNQPEMQRKGSVGKPLPHLRVEFADDGEILVRGGHSLGYLGDGRVGELIATGDFGHFDADGFLYITGRKKNIFITSFGRNVSPEWVEGEIAAHPGIAQAAVFGEARPFNSAVIVSWPGATAAAIQTALDKANERLPDYAQVRAWVAASEPFTPVNQLATANGRLRRDRIHGQYASQIDILYQSQA
jgi:long-subunit acyl-CoA synthetase (AMP-forming)